MHAELKKKIMFFVGKKKSRNVILLEFDKLEEYLYFLVFVFANNYHCHMYLFNDLFCNSLNMP